LTLMGAKIESANERAPLRLIGGQRLRGIAYSPDIASAQVKSAVLLAGLYASGQTIVHEPHPTRDYTESMLRCFGVNVVSEGYSASVQVGAFLKAQHLLVPSDFSSAAFFIVAATCVANSDLTLVGVGINPRRTGLLTVLQQMGAHIVISNQHINGGELVADLRVRSAPLQGIVIDPRIVPDMIDEFPALFVAAAFAQGETLIRGAAELRVKESDRIAVMAKALQTLGVQIEELADGARIFGGSIGSGRVSSHGDHRCAMALCVAGWCGGEPVYVEDCANVATSFPKFDELAHSIGGSISAQLT
jgi:3-phosphoshikimate 1-carboxyvinyltransferase